MPFKIKTQMTTVDFAVFGEARMESLLGPDDMMLPYAARVEYLNGEFTKAVVWGWRISARTGKPTKQSHFRSFEIEELTRDPDPDFGSTPQWVRKLVVSATFGGRV